MTLMSFASLLDGARAMACLVVALCFMRLARATHDRLYHAFALAFVLLAATPVLLGLGIAPGDYSVVVFMPRLLAFVTIIIAIVDKNRRADRVNARPQDRGRTPS